MRKRNKEYEDSEVKVLMNVGERIRNKVKMNANFFVVSFSASKDKSRTVSKARIVGMMKRNSSGTNDVNKVKGL